ncbi:MAG: glycine/sarcosine/betaine reductase complex component C subunit beta [Eubacteriales bacterium]|nr:glycine/sarcosine/betaine reductase complex component C subunit beta [Eubacteriales bacterium]MDD4323682.1 glycine/sarcosine/betaine reductase complex component C subunit beta [Eubacteriales bacterium]MDD4540656.1 glycine/sarcosine/betaine reductase complex component C subunit beta [Eubacteriales bacterium]
MNSVIRGTGYPLVHVPDMVLLNGTTQTTERIVNPESEYLKKLGDHIRTYEQACAYYPNQVYIGNYTPEILEEVEFPWYDKPSPVSDRFGKYGEIMPQEEFYLLMQASDEFELLFLEKAFVEKYKPELAKNGIITEAILDRIHEGVELEQIKKQVNEHKAEPLRSNGELVGYVKNAHAIDENLSAHVMLENLVSKASSVLSLLYALKDAGMNPDDVEYVIDCSEEACGDMNQRGGGNFAKAAAETAGLNNATGSDVRGFCAAPSHALTMAASLIKAGTFNCVAVTAGGSTAKLGMNGKEHVNKDLPILEDVLGGFATILTANDNINPEINLDIQGIHTVGTGSSPQNVIGSLVVDPLERAGLKVTDINKYSPEMQNPDVTKPAGAGDVPQSNMKMIGALAVKRGDMDRKDLNDFVSKHGVVGFAPTQGHIPSGVPYLGHARQEILDGKMEKVMIVGKGSLFLGRLTNLFDGISFIVQANEGVEEEATVSRDEIRGLIAESLRDFASSLLESR